MKETDCLGLPYPECDPPLTKDLSDIAQLRDLAFATDAAVQALADRVNEQLLRPDAVVMFGSIGLLQGQDQTQSYTNTIYDNAGMADTIAGGIRVQESGWYEIGGWISAAAVPTVAFSLGVRIEPQLNGEPFTARQGPGWPADREYASWVNTVFLTAGDFLTTTSHHQDSPTRVVDYSYRLWAVQVLSNV